MKKNYNDYSENNLPQPLQATLISLLQELLSFYIALENPPFNKDLSAPRMWIALLHYRQPHYSITLRDKSCLLNTKQRYAWKDHTSRMSLHALWHARIMHIFYDASHVSLANASRISSASAHFQHIRLPAPIMCIKLPPRSSHISRTHVCFTYIRARQHPPGSILTDQQAGPPLEAATPKPPMSSALKILKGDILQFP